MASGTDPQSVQDRHGFSAGQTWLKCRMRCKINLRKPSKTGAQCRIIRIKNTNPPPSQRLTVNEVQGYHCCIASCFSNSESIPSSFKFAFSEKLKPIQHIMLFKPMFGGASMIRFHKTHHLLILPLPSFILSHTFFIYILTKCQTLREYISSVYLLFPFHK